MVVRGSIVLLLGLLSCTDRVPATESTTGMPDLGTSTDESGSLSSTGTPSTTGTLATGDSADSTGVTTTTAGTDTGDPDDECAALGPRPGEVLWADSIDALQADEVFAAVARPRQQGLYVSATAGAIFGSIAALDLNGEVLWQSELVLADEQSAATHLSVDEADGAVVVAGEIWEPPVGVDLQVARPWLGRVSARGAVEWIVEPTSAEWDQQTVAGLLLDGDGSILLVERSVVHGIRVRRFDKSGVEGTSTTLLPADGTTLPEPEQAAFSAAGDLVLVGSLVARSQYQRWASRFAPTGDVLWTRIWPTMQFEDDGAILDLVALGDDRFALGGRVGKRGAAYDAWVTVVDGSGGTLWESSWGDASHDFVYAIATGGSDGDIVTAGFRGPDAETRGLASGQVRAFEAGGAPRWDTLIGGGTRFVTTYFVGVAFVSACEVMVVGGTDFGPVAARVAL